MKLQDMTCTYLRNGRIALAAMLTAGGIIAAPATAQVAPLPGDLVITEVMQNPSAVLDSVGEWFEITNVSGNLIELAGLTIREDDGNNETFTIPASPSIPLAPGAYFVFGINGSPGTNGGVTVDYVYTGMTLGNGSDELLIETAALVMIDRIAWDGGSVWPDPNGASMNLEPTLTDAVSNDAGVNWCEATSIYGLGDNGTPGAANDSCAIDCNSNGTPDDQDLANCDGSPWCSDCNENGIIDECDIDVDMISCDANLNGIPDECEQDPSIIFTEVMRNPNAVLDNLGEWFEIHNVGIVAVDIQGWTFRDQFTAGFSLPVGIAFTLNPGDYFVLGNNGDPVTNGGVTVDYAYNGLDMNLSNSVDSLIMEDIAGCPIDRIVWDGGVVWPGTAGASMSLDPDFYDPFDNDNGLNWCDATSTYGAGDLGTPGAFNDQCFRDCNDNQVEDSQDILDGTSIDCNMDGIPDECQTDCNNNGIHDSCDVDPADPDGNLEISLDCDLNGVPDECQVDGNDCNLNGVPDNCDVTSGSSLDCNSNGTPDECEFDCNGNNIPDQCDITTDPLLDLDGNGLIDSCQISQAPAVEINEVRIDMPSFDFNEYFELEGTPSASLDGVWYIAIGSSSGGSNSGIIEAIVPLWGSTMPADGLFLCVEASFTLRPIANADLVLGAPEANGTGGGMDFQNGEHVTHMLVTNFWGTAALGDDVDADNNGIIDAGAPWDDVVDAVGFIKVVQEFPTQPPGEGWAYGEILGFEDVGPDSASGFDNIPGQIYRCEPDNTWTIGLWDPALNSDTPAEANLACEAAGTCVGDTNGDNTVNTDDFLAVLGAWGSCPAPCPPTCSEDFNDDCLVNTDDFLALLGAWGPCPAP